MINDKKTPFDREKVEKTLLKLVVHTESLAEEIENYQPEIKKIIELSGFPFIDVIFTPTKNEKVKDVLKNNNIMPTEYRKYENGITIKKENFEYTIFATLNSKHMEKDFYQAVVPGSKVNYMDLYLGHDDYYDYFIINPNDPFYVSKIRRERDIDPKYALELTRILLVNKGLFYVAPNYTINEGFYYLYRFKKIFHRFQYAWSIVVYAKGKSLSEDVYNQFDSLSQRLDFICRAADKVSYFALKWPDNDTQSNTLYHFGYLVMLITGAFDDLAWIIRFVYKLNISNMKTTLKIPKKEQSTVFYDQLLSKNVKLHSYLTNNLTQSIIRMFYPTRDALQHRNFVKGLRYYRSQDRLYKNLFEIPAETIEWIKIIAPNDNRRSYGIIYKSDDVFCVDAHLFTKKLMEHFADVVNNILGNIEWDEYIKDFDEHLINKIHESRERFQKGVGRFLHLGREPIY